MTTIKMIRNDTIDLGPEEFIKLKTERPESIAGVEIIPPVLGSDNFGKIRVKLTSPRYEARL